jgi:hypothetical protein
MKLAEFKKAVAECVKAHVHTADASKKDVVFTVKVDGCKVTINKAGWDWSVERDAAPLANLQAFQTYLEKL